MTRILSVPMQGPNAAAAAAVFLMALLAPGGLSAGAASYSSEDLVASIDQDRMSDTIEALEAFGSREFHLESSRLAAEYIVGVLEDMGVEVEQQHFTVGDANVSNVIGTIHGDDEGAGMYLFGAHYDSENRAAYDLSSAEDTTAPGADDDASGVAAVLEMARVLAGSNLTATVKFVLFGAEEMGYDNSGGCEGSRHFVARETALDRAYSGTAVLDMVGYRAGQENKAVLIVNSDDQPLTASALKAVSTFGIDLDLETLVAPTLTYSDHSSFWAAGMPSMLVVEELDDDHFPVNPYYHTSYDTLDTLSLEQSAAVTEALLGGLLLLLEGDGWPVLVFGAALISALIVSVALFIHVRRHARKGRR